MDTISNSEVYWAAADTKTAAEAAKKKIDQYYLFLQTNGLLRQWGTNFNYYFGGRVTQGIVQFGGQEGEYQVLNTNHFRNYLLHILQLVTGQRPSFEPRAINSDVKSQEQAILAKGLLDYYMREKRIERDLDTSCEFALVFGEGYIHTRWDALRGKVHAVDPDSGQEHHEGDIVSTSYEPIDVIRDPNLRQYRDREWLVLRDRVSKYDLMARYPEWATELLQVKSMIDPQQHYRVMQNQTTFDSDLITVYTLYHLPTPSCPDGREMLLVDDSLVLSDGPLSYRHMPVHRLSAKEIFSSPFGYTVAFDLSALQKSFDDTISVIKSNQAMFAVQNVLVPIGSGFESIDVGGQLKVLSYDPGAGKPEALNLLATPTEVFNFLGMIEKQMQTISGINDITLGNNTQDLSGAAMALMQSMAIEFNGPMQDSYVKAIEDVGTAIIELLQDNAATPRVAAISGKYNRSYVKEFSADDLDQLDRVIVDAGNPMLQTTAGKVQLAQQMMQMGFIKMPDELLQVINTGTLQPLIQGKTQELLQLAQENQLLKDGTSIQVIITDDHVLHINEHKSVLADPSARLDPKIVNTTLDHLQQHISMLQDPNYQILLKLLNEPALGAPPGPGGPPPGGPTPPPGPAAPGLPQGPSAGGTAPGLVDKMQPNQPSMPKNPLSHQPFNPTTGGMQ